ncbi:MAG: adenylate/guanylate cyclase domain-containing protein [Kamptonema sp. SIO4C4]|nr:adenylate/guanylate cyclase domain-containing protein [Kamptonema sp. SIO4C4]
MSWILVFLSQATLMPFRWKLHLLSQTIPFICFFILHSLGEYSLDTMLGLKSAEIYLFMFWICCICNFSVFMFERLAYAEFLSLKKLNLEQKKSEQLLLNILPPSVAHQLKENHNTIAETYQNVTILFADIVGFTQLSSQISATELVELLNTIFSRFDRLAEKYGLEKIKTIGDAYMVVAGLPEPREDHASAIADMAIDMQLSLSQYNQHNQHPLNLRIGIHTGDVVAGVIGLKKFAYDLWGDTVNTASRMESHSLPGKIQVSESTYHVLKDQYQFQKRGKVSIKGKGDMDTYFLFSKQ